MEECIKNGHMLSVYRFSKYVLTENLRIKKNVNLDKLIEMAKEKVDEKCKKYSFNYELNNVFNIDDMLCPSVSKFLVNCAYETDYQYFNVAFNYMHFSMDAFFKSHEEKYNTDLYFSLSNYFMFIIASRIYNQS